MTAPAKWPATVPVSGTLTEAERHARSLRRAAAKRHHPDLGGDADEFVRVMQGLAAGDGGWDPLTVTVTTRSRAARAVRTTSKTVLATVRRRLPRSFPGSRRYGHL